MLRHALPLACFLALPAAAQDLSDDRVKQLALEAILENPEIVMEAVAILQAREAELAAAAQAQALADAGGALTDVPEGMIGGNPDGDVTVVEFFDYNCGYCRRAGPEVTALLAADDGVRLVYREWPVLGEGSEAAARVALASRAQGRYGEVHAALMGSRQRLDEAAALGIAEGLGLDMDRLRADMTAPAVEAHLAETMRLAQSLGFSGTPSFVIGDQTVPGFVEAEVMGELVEEARGG